MKPDYEKLKELTIRAQGDRSMRQYAKDAGVSYASITRIRKGDYLPSAATISKLTTGKANPQGGVTCDEMMAAAGYRDRKAEEQALSQLVFEMRDDRDNSVNHEIVIHTRPWWVEGRKELVERERKAQGLIYAGLAESGLEFTAGSERAPRLRRWDVAVDIKLGIVNLWLIDFKFFPRDKFIPMGVETMLGSMLLSEIPHGAKVSIAVDSRAAYEYLSRYRDKLPYRGELSVIYIDLEQYKIMEETYLSHYTEGDHSSEFFIV